MANVRAVCEGSNWNDWCYSETGDNFRMLAPGIDLGTSNMKQSRSVAFLLRSCIDSRTMWGHLEINMAMRHAMLRGPYILFAAQLNTSLKWWQVALDGSWLTSENATSRPAHGSSHEIDAMHNWKYVCIKYKRGRRLSEDWETKYI